METVGAYYNVFCGIHPINQKGILANLLSYFDGLPTK
jgi:hypothetical protein